MLADFFYGGIAAAQSPNLPQKADLYDPGLLEVIEAGLKLSSVDYVNAMIERNAIWQRVRTLFETYDLLVTPAMAVLPFAVGQNNADPLPGQNGRPLRWSPFTYLFNLTGNPAITVPCARSESGLPVGLQIVGRRFDDLAVLQAARALELMIFD